MRYVEVHCSKCDQTFKLDIGDGTVEEAKESLAKQSQFHCPGHHVELSGPLNYWQSDWELHEDDVKPMTDEEWLVKQRERFEHVVDTTGLPKVVDKIVGFTYGMCSVIRDGEEELIDFSHAPSGKRYYFLSAKAPAAGQA